MKLYYLLGWLLSPFAKAAFYAFSRLTGTKRARVVVKNEDGDILLLKTWLGANKWGLPGGGAERDEPVIEAAAREVFEETGIKVTPSDLRLLFTLRSMGHEEAVYMTTAPKASLPPLPPNRFEIEKMAWVAMEEARPLDSIASRVLQKMAAGE